MLVMRRLSSVIAGVLAMIGCVAHMDAHSAATHEARAKISGNGGHKSKPARARLVARTALVMSMDPDSAQRDADICRPWKYDSSSLTKNFQSMEKVSQRDWYVSCSQLACSAKGDAELKGKVYQVEVNGSGWISLTGRDGVTSYWLSRKQLPGFVADCNCCEDSPEER
jgi:hypothetical protein